MSTDKKIAPWEWRQAIRDAPDSVKPLTRLLCQTISDFLNYEDISGGCFPNVKTLMRATNLSNRAIADHIEAARCAGLLHVAEKAKGGQFKNNVYFPRFPPGHRLSGALKEAPREPRSCEPPSSGPREAQASIRVKRTSPNRVSGAHAYLSTYTNPSIEARSRAMDDDFDASISAGWLRAHRHSHEFGVWQQHTDQHDRALGDQMRRVIYISIPGYHPWPGCPLPKLYLPNRADGPSATKGSHHPHSKAKSNS